MKLVSLLTLVFAASATAQTANSQDCLADKLLSAQTDSIVVNFNAKIIKLVVTPETEIWRRGADLTSPQQLVTGDSIYVKCADKPAPDGSPVATMIAAVQKDNGVDLNPHHIREISVCMGRLIRIAPDSLALSNNHGGCTARVPPGADIWRGETYHDTNVLKLGDEIGSRTFVSYPSGDLLADTILANIARAEGKIVSVKPDRVVVKEDRLGRVTVFLDSRTKCDECSTKDLRKGSIVLATGLEITKGSFRATYITLEQ